MTSPKTASLGPSDFAAIATSAQEVEPRAPLHRVTLADGEQSYSFTLDNDLIKLVTLTPGPGQLDVRVRYATDTVVQDDRHVVPLSSDPEISADGLGLVVSWRASLIPGLSWPQMRKSRRF